MFVMDRMIGITNFYFKDCCGQLYKATFISFFLKHSTSFCEGETLKRAFNARLDIPKGLTWPRPSSSS